MTTRPAHLRRPLAADLAHAVTVTWLTGLGMLLRPLLPVRECCHDCTEEAS